MNPQDFIFIMKQHGFPEEIILEKSKNLTEIWDAYISSVFYNTKIEQAHWDNKLREALDNFRHSDGLEIVSKKGKILKRFAHFYKSISGEPIPDNIMGIMGDLLQGLVNKELSASYFVDFTSNFDWKDGDFGKEGSCWWGCYSDSLSTFQDNGGWCIRFYDENGQGIGRTWLYPDPEGVLLGFNSYGVERPKVSKVIKKIFDSHGIELHYNQCGIENSHNSNIPYINGGSGFVLYPNDKHPETDYDLDMKVVEDENSYTCDGCNGRLHGDDITFVGGYGYCDSCLNDRFRFCDKCQEYCDADDVHEVAGNSRYRALCESCASRVGLYLCEDCGEYSEYLNRAEDTDNEYCERCSDNWFLCGECDKYFQNSSECPNCVETEPDENPKYENIMVGEGNVEFLGEPKHTKIYWFENIPGLIVVKNISWMVYHTNSKLGAMININKLNNAIDALIRLGELANWSQLSAEDIYDNRNLCSKVREIQSEIKRVD